MPDRIPAEREANERFSGRSRDLLEYFPHCGDVTANPFTGTDPLFPSFNGITTPFI